MGILESHSKPPFLEIAANSSDKEVGFKTIYSYSKRILGIESNCVQ